MIIDKITEVVCRHSKLQFSELIYDTRKREVVQYRQLAMYFAKLKTKNSLTTIGMYYGGRDHATVLHSIKTVNNLKDTNKKYKYDFDFLERKIDIELNNKELIIPITLLALQNRSKYYRMGLNR